LRSVIAQLWARGGGLGCSRGASSREQRYQSESEDRIPPHGSSLRNTSTTDPVAVGFREALRAGVVPGTVAIGPGIAVGVRLLGARADIWTRVGVVKAAWITVGERTGIEERVPVERSLHAKAPLNASSPCLREQGQREHSDDHRENDHLFHRSYLLPDSTPVLAFAAQAND